MDPESDFPELLRKGLRHGLPPADVEALCLALVQLARDGKIVAESAALELALHALSSSTRDATLPADFLSRIEARLETRPGSGTPGAGDERNRATILQFARKLTHDPALLRRIGQGTDRQQRLALCVQAGEMQGFRFSRADLEGLLASTEPANDGALTDEQLEAVAGGAAPEIALLGRLLGD